MVDLPSRQEQIVQVHAGLIVGVINVLQNRESPAKLEAVLEHTAKKGWVNLVTAIRKILNGIRDQSVFTDLDDEDTAIVEAILRGLQNPETLPDPHKQISPLFAASGLAQMIHPASKGDRQALQMLNDMSTQMSKASGDMGMLGDLMRRLIHGERDADKLCQGLSAQCKSLVHCILEELGKIEAH